jgi:hypothetical protein
MFPLLTAVPGLIQGSINAVKKIKENHWDRAKGMFDAFNNNKKKRRKNSPMKPPRSQWDRMAYNILASGSTTEVVDAGHAIVGGSFEIDVPVNMGGYEICIPANPLVSPDDELRASAARYAQYEVLQLEVSVVSGVGEDAAGIRDIGLLPSGATFLQTKLTQNLAKMGVQGKVSEQMEFDPDLRPFSGKYSIWGGLGVDGNPFNVLGYVDGGTQSCRYTVSYTYHMWGKAANPSKVPTYAGIGEVTFTSSATDDRALITGELGSQFLILGGYISYLPDLDLGVGDLVFASDVQGAQKGCSIIQNGQDVVLRITASTDFRCCRINWPAPS